MGIERDSLPTFLAWLGVAEWPRLIDSTQVESEFLDYAKQRLNYPAVFEERSIHVFDSVKELPTNCNFRTVKSLDDIDVILSSESDAILAWLANDHRATAWLKASEEHGIFDFYPPRASIARIYQGELPSYIRWKVKYSPWLRANKLKPLAPIDCMVNDAAVAGLFPRPIMPTIVSMEELSLSQSLLKHALINAGVRESVDDLDSEEIYALLAELPEKDTSGDLAKKLYNFLIKTVDFELDETGANYEAFAEEGRIYANHGDEQGYFPVNETYHVDVEGFPQELLKSLPVACLLKKRGADKVRRLFRVNVLDKEAVNEKVIGHRAAACTELANQHFQSAKKYIEIYRHSHFAKAPGRNIFEGLELVVCEQVQSQITFKQETLDNPLPHWSYSIQDGYLYVCCNPVNAGDPYNPLLANTIGDAIASIFGLIDGDSFSKIYQCDASIRPELLSKMLGDNLDDDLDSMLQTLIEGAAEQVMPEPSVIIGPVQGASPNVPPPTPPLKPTVQSVAAEPEPATTGWDVPSAIGIEPVEHVPEKPGARVGVRVSGGGSGLGGAVAGSTATSDGKAGEDLAKLFEEKQGRFPLYIGHITGYETITADLLSFRSAEDRALFESGDDQSSALIERVIEAKEKRSGGRVKLTINEVNTAAKWKNKYYIYRFTPIDTETVEYELKVLNNPLSQLEAVASSVEISLDAATTSQQFRVFGEEDNDSK